MEISECVKLLEETCPISLEQQIQVVREARHQFSREKLTLDVAKALWEEEHRSQIMLLEHFKQDLEEAETKLREMTIQAYLETQNKKPAPGVGIRVIRAFSYEAEKAKAWAVEHKFYHLLNLNDNKFKKAADGLNLDFVTIEEKPTATIAEDL